MKDFKIIATEDRKFFEEKIKEYMELGYSMKHTNLAMSVAAGRITVKLGFYAYMEK